MQKEPTKADTPLPHTPGLHEWIMEFNTSFPMRTVSTHRERVRVIVAVAVVIKPEEKEEDH